MLTKAQFHRVIMITFLYFHVSESFQLKGDERGEKCRLRCNVAMNYASGLCAGLGSFGAPLVPVLCAGVDITGILCAAAEGVLWAFGGYCTSSKS